MGIGANLKKILSSRRISIRELSKMTGIPLNTLYSITKNDNKNVRSDTLHKIANALKIDVNDLMDSIVEQNNQISITLDLSNNNKHLANLRILESHFAKLNFLGEEEAIKRIEELTHLSKYTDNKELLIKPVNSD